jgi:hypothetical protein
MKHLKLFESTGYQNRQITVEEWTEDERENIDFDSKEISKIDRYFSDKGIPIQQQGGAHRTLGTFSIITADLKKLLISIQKVEDEWFLVEIVHKKLTRIERYECDQIGGLFEILDKYLSDFPDNPKFQIQIDQKKKSDDLKKEIMKKMKGMSVSELESLLSKI